MSENKKIRERLDELIRQKTEENEALKKLIDKLSPGEDTPGTKKGSKGF